MAMTDIDGPAEPERLPEGRELRMEPQRMPVFDPHFGPVHSEGERQVSDFDERMWESAA
jgi:hypothetical protein